MTNYELINIIIKDADHIKLSEYNIRYLTLASSEGIFDEEIYDRMRDIDSGGFGYAFESIMASSTLDEKIKVQLFIIAIRSAKMPTLFKTDRDIKFYFSQAGCEYISEYIESNIDFLVENCKTFKGIESDDACRFFLRLLGRWYLGQDIGDENIAQLYDYNIFNSMIAIGQVKSVASLSTDKFLIKLSSASDPEFNGIFFGKIFQRIFGNSAFVYDARITKDYALHVSYFHKDVLYSSALTEVAEEAHGVDASKRCFCIEKKFASASELVDFIIAVDEEGIINGKEHIVSYSVADNIKSKFNSADITRNSITYDGETFTKPEYNVNTNRDNIKRSFNSILFKAIDAIIC